MAVPLGAVQTIVTAFFWLTVLPVGVPRTTRSTFPVSVIVDPAAFTVCLSA